jgi:hypothetical protein
MPWQVEAVDNLQQTALHHAAAACEDYGNPEAAAAVSQLLLQRGARVDARNQVGAVPLHASARNWYLEAMRLLLDHGAEVDALDDMGRTPLMAAVARSTVYEGESAASSVQLLAGRGADVDAVDSDGRSALSHACGNAFTDADTVRALLAAGARVGRANGPLLIDELLAAAGADKLPDLGVIDALIGAGAGVSPSNVRRLAEAAARVVGEAVLDGEEGAAEAAQAFVVALPRVLAAAQRALDEDEGARVAAKLAAAVEADRRDVANGLRALITGAAAEARRLEAARAASAQESGAPAAEHEAMAEERRAAAAERVAAAQERVAAAAESEAVAQERVAAAADRAELWRRSAPSCSGPRPLPSAPGVKRPLEAAPDSSDGGEAERPANRARRG